MNTIYIDFSEIGDMEDFYAQLKEKIELPEYFGDNLDALYDCISGDLDMPLHIEFVRPSRGRSRLLFFLLSGTIRRLKISFPK